MDKDKFNRYLNFAQNTVYSEPETPAFHTPLIKLAIEIVLVGVITICMLFAFMDHNH